MAKGYKSGPAVQGAIRAKARMDYLLEQGNFRAALGVKTSVWPEVGMVPRPSYFSKNGARVWCYG